MKRIARIMSLLVALSGLWINLLLSSVIAKAYTWLVSSDADAFISSFILLLSFTCLFVQLPLYLIVSLGCYGLLMVGVGVMRFPTCPQEAIFLQEDIVEAKGYLKGKGIDVVSE